MSTTRIFKLKEDEAELGAGAAPASDWPDHLDHCCILVTCDSKFSHVLDNLTFARHLLEVEGIGLYREQFQSISQRVFRVGFSQKNRPERWYIMH